MNLANEGLEARKKDEEVAQRKRKAEEDKTWEGTLLPFTYFSVHLYPILQKHANIVSTAGATSPTPPRRRKGPNPLSLDDTFTLFFSFLFLTDHDSYSNKSHALFLGIICMYNEQLFTPPLLFFSIFLFRVFLPQRNNANALYAYVFSPHAHLPVLHSIYC